MIRLPTVTAGHLVLDEGLGSRFAGVALANVVREYPNKLDHLMTSDDDVRSPSQLHPVFYGCYDWHSSVHMHWTLVVLLDRFPALPEADAIAARLDAHFAADRIAGELAYLQRPAAASFERPYGWAWLLKLCEALHRSALADARFAGWRDRMQPLADAIVVRTLAYLPRAPYPSRAGMHANSAFALSLMLDYAQTVGDPALLEAIVAKAVAWFGDDHDYPVAYETSSEDFLSAGLVEAMLMRRVFAAGPEAIGRELALARFGRWWDAFVPDVTQVAHWLTPLVPSDRSDPRFSHIDGLNLARAWCWAALADALPDALQVPVGNAIDLHLRESLPHAADGHYVGTHWLASFALLALGNPRAKFDAAGFSRARE